jgi:hypothetical protein
MTFDGFCIILLTIAMALVLHGQRLQFRMIESLRRSVDVLLDDAIERDRRERDPWASEEAH